MENDEFFFYKWIIPCQENEMGKRSEHANASSKFPITSLQ